jgi:Tol biopolymer transport system component
VNRALASLPERQAAALVGKYVLGHSVEEIAASTASESTILVTRADGSVTDVGAQAGLTGLNCLPKWSPDGTMVAFQHCDAVTDKPHCQEGFSSWVMNADGSDAYTIAPPDMPSNWGPTWFPDGTLLVEVKAAEPTEYRVDLVSRAWVKVPVVMGGLSWSPNWEHLVYTARIPGTEHGESGVWHQLVLADALGGNPRVLVQQFVADDEVAQYYPTAEQLELKPDMNWIDDLQYHIGPAEPQWSPSGDQIAFRAALPFDPAGPYFREQVQIWIYDLNAEKLVQLTYGGAHYSLVWSPNKLPVGGDDQGGGMAAP